MLVNDLLYSQWLHTKSGHTYFIVGECRLEATNEPAFLYIRTVDRNGIPWARAKDEFLDGRFVRIDQSP